MPITMIIDFEGIGHSAVEKWCSGWFSEEFEIPTPYEWACAAPSQAILSERRRTFYAEFALGRARAVYYCPFKERCS